jgi:predicted ArsR family transcriptional regulator
VKFVRASAAPSAQEVAAAEAPADARTRDRVCRAVLEQGPVSASHLAQRLGLTPAAVRRHLDALAAEGLVAVWEASSITGPGRRGRGRPARRFVATDRGHTMMSAGYDDLASSALRYLRASLGEEAVRGFAEQRVGELEGRYRPQVDAAGQDTVHRAEALAAALTADGYAATVRPAADRIPLVRDGLPQHAGTQLCQGHCPVQHVAREFPELCEAETDAFSRLLGVHVQRLATLAHGEHVCTTHIPTGHIPVKHLPATTVPPTSLTTGRQSE